MNTGIRNTTLAAVLSAMLTACGGGSQDAARVKLLDVAQAAARGSDRVTVDELAGWIVEQRADF
jgi:hypothetical protein